MSFTYRPYQEHCIDEARAAMKQYKRVLIYAPTGSGKTEVAIGIIKLAMQKGKRVAFVANRIGLVSQASRRFNASNVAHGIIQGDNSHHTTSDVVVCSIQTIARRGYPIVDLLVIDEAHGCCSQEYLKLLQAYNNVPVIGLSATPFTKGLGQQHSWGKPFEHMVIATTIKELIQQKFLVDCDIYAPSEPDLKGVKIVRGDYDERQLGIAVDKPRLIGDIVQHWKRLANGLPTVVFATNIAHSKHIVEEFLSDRVSAEHIDCYTTDDERTAILQRHQEGETTVISNVGVLAEGWDSPITSCMILARPTRMLTRWIQMCGRALRPYPDKTKALILDHSGTCHRLGYPTDDLPLELNDGKKHVSQDAQPQEKLPHMCINCHFMIPAGVGVCPQCGCVPVRQNKVKVHDGELKKVERKPEFTMEQKQELYSSALGLAQKRNKSEGWAAHLYKDVVGAWPNGLEKTTCEPVEKIVKMAQHNNIRFAKSKKTGANNEIEKSAQA